jgi:general secretion pathway protein J
MPGFTLLELLLSVLVFGLLASTAYGVLDSITLASAAQEQAGERLRLTQLGLLRLERELRQVVAVDPGRADTPALSGNMLDVNFSTLAPSLSGGMSEIRPVIYRYSGGNLYRFAGQAVGRLESPDNAHLLIPDLKSAAFAYLDRNGSWRDSWSTKSGEKLPAAIRIQLDINGLGPVERLVELPGDRR